MEIISIVLEGELAHQDSIGTRSIIPANGIQAMSAGSGIIHSEYNPSNTKEVHFLQIWVIPDTKGVPPQYHRQTSLPTIPNEWFLIASKEGRANSIKIHQDVNLYAISLEKGVKTTQKLAQNRYGWIQMIEGEIKLNDILLKTGDAVAIREEQLLAFQALSPSRLLFFDLK